MAESDHNSEMQTIRIELAELKKTIELQPEIFVSQEKLSAELQSIRKDFSDLNVEVKKDSNFYKWMGSTGVFVALVLGAIGISQWRDIFKGLGAKADRQTAYQYDLAVGLALVNGKRPQDAAAHLRRCYDQTPLDETVAGALFLAYQSSDSWTDGALVANALRRKRGIDQLDDPWIINNIGLSLLYEGRDDKAKLDEAASYLKRAASSVKGDEDERSVWINLWVYDLYTGNLAQAKTDLENAFNAKSTDLGKRVWNKSDWEGQLDWSLVKYLEARNKAMQKNAQDSLADLVKSHGISET